MLRTSASTLGPKVVIDTTQSGLDAASTGDAPAQVLGKRREPSESDKSEFGLKSAKSGVVAIKNLGTSARSDKAKKTGLTTPSKGKKSEGGCSSDSTMVTEEVEPDCDNYSCCKQKAEPGNTYCKKCEDERKCLDYPTCDGKPGLGELFCESCLEANEEKEVCENCGNRVGLYQPLCEPCMEEAALRSNGVLWWE